MTEHEQQQQQQQHEDEHEHDDDVEHGDANDDGEVSLPFDVTVGVISMIQQDWWIIRMPSAKRKPSSPGNSCMSSDALSGRSSRTDQNSA